MKICIHSFFFFHVKIHNQRHKTSRLGWMWIVFWIFFWIPITFYLGFFAVSSNTWTLGGFVLSFLPKCFDYFNEFFHISPNCKRIIAKYSRRSHNTKIMACFAIAAVVLLLQITDRQGIYLLLWVFTMYLSYFVHVFINSIPALFFGSITLGEILYYPLKTYYIYYP